eukprot:gene18268-biopygen20433
MKTLACPKKKTGSRLRRAQRPGRNGSGRVRDAPGTRPFLPNLSCGTCPGRVLDASAAVSPWYRILAPKRHAFCRFALHRNLAYSTSSEGQLLPDDHPVGLPSCRIITRPVCLHTGASSGRSAIIPDDHAASVPDHHPAGLSAYRSIIRSPCQHTGSTSGRPASIPGHHPAALSAFWITPHACRSFSSQVLSILEIRAWRDGPDSFSDLENP